MAEATPNPSVRPSFRTGLIAVVLALAGLALVGYAIRAASIIDDVNRRPPLTLLTDATDIARQQTALAGAFATGDAPGDRGLIIDAAGTVRFQVLGARGAVQSEDADTGRFGRRDSTLLLVTTQSGEIEITHRDTLVYYGDTYRRTR
jgi:hypothetical protein